jgi:hypothetical protein
MMSMRFVSGFALALSGWAAGCAAPAAPNDTVLVGTVVRGPIQPVCRVDVACDAPFSAGFTVERGERVVASFRSDNEGRFEVALTPGVYVIVPSPDAPILSPTAQRKDVAVGSSGETRVLLHFDTGIR